MITHEYDSGITALHRLRAGDQSYLMPGDLVCESYPSMGTRKPNNVGIILTKITGRGGGFRAGNVTTYTVLWNSVVP